MKKRLFIDNLLKYFSNFGVNGIDMDNLKTKTTSFVDILYLHTLNLDNMHSTRQQALEILKHNRGASVQFTSVKPRCLVILSRNGNTFSLSVMTYQ